MQQQQWLKVSFFAIRPYSRLTLSFPRHLVNGPLLLTWLLSTVKTMLPETFGECLGTLSGNGDRKKHKNTFCPKICFSPKTTIGHRSVRLLLMSAYTSVGFCPRCASAGVILRHSLQSWLTPFLSLAPSSHWAHGQYPCDGPVSSMQGLRRIALERTLSLGNSAGPRTMENKSLLWE